MPAILTCSSDSPPFSFCSLSDSSAFFSSAVWRIDALIRKSRDILILKCDIKSIFQAKQYVVDKMITPITRWNIYVVSIIFQLQALCHRYKCMLLKTSKSSCVDFKINSGHIITSLSSDQANKITTENYLKDSRSEHPTIFDDWSYERPKGKTSPKSLKFKKILFPWYHHIKGHFPHFHTIYIF